jgi:amino acid transporter
MTMNKRVVFWILTLLTYGAYYVLFAELQVEGHETPPINFLMLDIVTTFIVLLFFAFLIALVLSLISWKGLRYSERFGSVFPVVSFLVTLFFFMLMWIVRSQGLGPL